MLLVPVPWAKRVWALPFLSVLAPSERYAAHRGKHHKKITDWARQLLLLVRGWWPEREIVAVAQSHAEGRIVSVLEGGYNVPILAGCVTEHIQALEE